MKGRSEDAVVGVALGDKHLALVAGCRTEEAQERRYGTKSAPAYTGEPDGSFWNRLRKLLDDCVKSILQEIGASKVLVLGVAVPTKRWLSRTPPEESFRLRVSPGQRLGTLVPAASSPHPIAVALGYFFGPYGAGDLEEGAYLVFNADFADAYAAVVEVRSTRTATGTKTAFSLLAEEHAERDSAQAPTDQNLARVLEDRYRIPATALYEAADHILLGDSCALTRLSQSDTSERGIDIEDVFQDLLNNGVADCVERMVQEASTRSGIPLKEMRKALPSGGTGVFALLLPDLGIEVDWRFFEKNEVSRPAAEGALVYAMSSKGLDLRDLLLPSHAEYGIVFRGDDDKKLIRLVPAFAQLPAAVDFEVILREQEGQSAATGDSPGRDQCEFRLWRGLGCSPDTAMTSLGSIALPPSDARSSRQRHERRLRLKLSVAENEEKVTLDILHPDAPGPLEYSVAEDFHWQ